MLCCYDPVYGSKGGHSYPYAYQVFAYDVLDLLAVKNGTKQPWDVTPYGVWDLGFQFAKNVTTILGAAYDPASQRIYLSEAGADCPGCCGYLPVIHVYKLNIAGATPPPSDTTRPSTPTGLRVR